MAGQILDGEDILADDFIYESEKDATPANDQGRVAKLESDAKIARAFTHLNGKDTYVAGENITGATTPQACFIMSAQRLNKYDLIDWKAEDVESEFEMYNSGGGTDRRVGLKFNSGSFVKLTGLAFEGQREGNIDSMSYELALYAQDGSGFPTGAAITTQSFTVSSNVSTSNAILEHWYIEFSTPVTITASTNYVLVMRETSTNGGSTQNIHIYAHSTGSNMIYSTNGGSSWSNGNPTHSGASWNAFVLYGYKDYTIGRVYLSDGDDPQRNYFDGFVYETDTAGNNVALYWGSATAYFTSLDEGSEYFLSTTPGGITTTKGKGRKIGKAINDTTILLSESVYFSDVYADDLAIGSDETNTKPAISNAMVEIETAASAELTYVISNKLHEALFGLHTKRMTVNSLTNNAHTGACLVAQGEYMALNFASGNTYTFYAGTTRVRYYL